MIQPKVAKPALELAMKRHLLRADGSTGRLFEAGRCFGWKGDILDVGAYATSPTSLSEPASTR